MRIRWPMQTVSRGTIQPKFVKNLCGACPTFPEHYPASETSRLSPTCRSVRVELGSRSMRRILDQRTGTSAGNDRPRRRLPKTTATSMKQDSNDQHRRIVQRSIQILVSLRWQILQSASLREPRTRRLWNALFHRRTSDRPGVVFQRASDHGSQAKPVSVLPLSSSR